MFYLLRDLDTSKYTHRTYVVSSGDAFSAQRAVEFEQGLEAREKEQEKDKDNAKARDGVPSVAVNGQKISGKEEAPKCTGPEHYNVALIPRARRVHQSLLTTPFSALRTLLFSIPVLLAAPSLLPNQSPGTPYESAVQDLPDLIVTNGPATGVIVILGSLILRFFNVRGANGRGKCKTIYAESFARVKGLSLSGKMLSRVVDRFLVQWEELEGSGGGRGEFWGVLV